MYYGPEESSQYNLQRPCFRAGTRIPVCPPFHDRFAYSISPGIRSVTHEMDRLRKTQNGLTTFLTTHESGSTTLPPSKLPDGRGAPIHFHRSGQWWESYS